MRELGAALQRDIFTESPCVRWGDISGLDTAKRLLGEAVVAPIRYPELFTGEAEMAHMPFQSSDRPSKHSV